MLIHPTVERADSAWVAKLNGLNPEAYLACVIDHLTPDRQQLANLRPGWKSRSISSVLLIGVDAA